MTSDVFNRQPVSRRRFLKHSGATAATLAATVGAWTRSSGEEPVQPDRKIRIGVVGGGFGCSFHWHEHPSCTVQAVSDLRTDRRDLLMQTYRCSKPYESLEKLILDDSIDAVGVFTEAPNHVRHCIEVLNAGKHVVCAVPAAMNLAECQELIDAVKRTGLTFMMAETSYWQQPTISARKFYEAGEFGTLYAVKSVYHHAGLESLWFNGDGSTTWRHGFPPMHYPTHCTAHLVGVSGERLVEVACQGWGDDHPALQKNAYSNPFWNETAQFKTDRGHPFTVEIWWAGAHGGGELAEWHGDKMSFLCDEYGRSPFIVRSGKLTELDSGGFARAQANVEPYQQPDWWKTDMLPEPLRHDSGHHGSHTFITHEFIDALQNDRRPAVDVYEAVAYTAPGIVAHQSALKGGALLSIPDFGRGA